MDITGYIKYYQNVCPKICDSITQPPYSHLNYQPSTYSNHTEKINSEERVRMKEAWVRNGNILYDDIKKSIEYTIKLYSEEFPLFSVQRMTDFRINRYEIGGFMSQHCDNIHHSHGQVYGFPQATVLLYLNDDYEGGKFWVADKWFLPKKGSAIIFPSNFMFPHKAEEVTKGSRWSIVSWLM